jgi:hypothetical protein
MKRLTDDQIVRLDEDQIKNIVAGNDNICAALGGAALMSAALLSVPGFMVFGAGFMIFCLDGHA